MTMEEENCLNWIRSDWTGWNLIREESRGEEKKKRSVLTYSCIFQPHLWTSYIQTHVQIPNLLAGNHVRSPSRGAD